MYSIVLFSLTAVAPLTPEAVTDAVKEVDWGLLCQCLYVPDSKCDEIKAHYPPEDHRKVLVDWWFSTDSAPSWRRLIQRLDYWGDEGYSSCSRAADKIRHNAEPVEGMCSTNTAVCGYQYPHLHVLFLFFLIASSTRRNTKPGGDKVLLYV